MARLLGEHVQRQQPQLAIVEGPVAAMAPAAVAVTLRAVMFGVRPLGAARAAPVAPFAVTVVTVFVMTVFVMTVFVMTVFVGAVPAMAAAAVVRFVGRVIVVFVVGVFHATGYISRYIVNQDISRYAASVAPLRRDQSAEKAGGRWICARRGACAGKSFGGVQRPRMSSSSANMPPIRRRA
ncbi:hypothetical protein [Ancylobacter mangrovi]|uniref:hypothetical protein n=1 Tax=Ancylobacter mangrovi TaxID=2972472 RepID=UPI002161F58C|nr:hypothetical protein [Ancylobacter mangrovi]MCS0503226.1 hypothetical protein [Ancylobacter mangrovi]